MDDTVWFPEGFLVRLGLKKPPQVRVQLNDLAHLWGGRAKKPDGIVRIVGPDGKTPLLVVGLGVTEAAEMQDAASAVWERMDMVLHRTGSPIDFAGFFESMGMPPTGAVPELLCEAIADRIQKHRRNKITDPPRDPWKGQRPLQVVKG